MDTADRFRDPGLRLLTGVNSVDLTRHRYDGVNVLKISENMLLNVAQSARQDPLKIRILVIGLGADVDTSALQRVANVAPYSFLASGSDFTSTRPTAPSL